MTLAVLATALLSAPALGANGRVVYFGTPEPDGTGGGYVAGDLEFGTLANTRVTASGKTAVILKIENRDGQTLNHVKIAGGDAADAKPYNLAFAKPAGNSLPDDASIAALTVLSGPAGLSCGTVTSDGFECAVGTLAAGASATFRIVIQTAAPGPNPYWFTGSWNEGWSSTGNNADYNFAVDNLDVQAANCANGTASWFFATEKVTLTDGDATTAACEDTSASVRSGLALGGSGGHAQVIFDTPATKPACPDLVRECIGNTVDVDIIDGAPVPGGVIWTMQFIGTRTIGGVIHYGDDYDPDDASTFDVIPLTKKFKCSATLTRDCWLSVTPSPSRAKPAYVIVEFVTDGNGKGGGFL